MLFDELKYLPAILSDLWPITVTFLHHRKKCICQFTLMLDRLGMVPGVASWTSKFCSKKYAKPSSRVSFAELQLNLIIKIVKGWLSSGRNRIGFSAYWLCIYFGKNITTWGRRCGSEQDITSPPNRVHQINCWTSRLCHFVEKIISNYEPLFSWMAVSVSLNNCHCLVCTVIQSKHWSVFPRNRGS